MKRIVLYSIAFGLIGIFTGLVTASAISSVKGQQENAPVAVSVPAESVTQPQPQTENKTNNAVVVVDPTPQPQATEIPVPSSEPINNIPNGASTPQTNPVSEPCK